MRKTLYAALATLMVLAVPVSAVPIDVESFDTCKVEVMDFVQVDVSTDALTATEFTPELRRSDTFRDRTPKSESYVTLTALGYQQPNLIYEVGWRNSQQV